MTTRKQHGIFNLPNNKELLLMKTDWLKCNESSKALKTGAVFIKQDEVDPGIYHAVDVTNLNWDSNDPNFVITSGIVDITAEWIKWKEFNEVFPNNFKFPDNTATVETVARLFYFHRNEFQGMITKTKSKERVIEELINHGISLEVIH